MADFGVLTEHKDCAKSSVNEDVDENDTVRKIALKNIAESDVATRETSINTSINTSVKDDIFIDRINMLVDDVEYDDDAILTFNPNLKQAVESRRSIILNDSRKCESRNGVETKFASGDSSLRNDSVEARTEQILADLRGRILDKFEKASENLRDMLNATNTLKNEFSELGKHAKKTALQQRRVLQSADAHIRNLDLVIYQKNIIKHLEDAAKHMKLFECHVTPDRKLIMVDPDDFGTDVDVEPFVTDFRANLVVDREFCPERSANGRQDMWDLF